MQSIPVDLSIETERLVLRMASVEETDFVWDATQYPGFNDGMYWNKPDSREEIYEFAANIEDAWLAGECFLFTFYDKTSGDPLGRIAIEQSCSAWSVGFWTHPKKQGFGYASEALGGGLRFVFEVLELEEIRACHAVWNLASRKVLERNGFRFRVHTAEGFQKGGEWVAQDSLSLFRDQWLKKRQSN